MPLLLAYCKDLTILKGVQKFNFNENRLPGFNLPRPLKRSLAAWRQRIVGNVNLISNVKVHERGDY